MAGKYILRLKEKFGERFDYSDLQYKNYSTKIKIRCKKHDKTFTILLNNHLKQKEGGCNLCKDSDKSSEIKLQQGEEKKELPWDEFKDLYFVTTFGRVFHKKKGTELRYTKRSGNYSVSLYYNTKQKKTFRVHNLIWECCEEPVRKKFIIYHKDRNVKNNRLDNLVCVTRSFVKLRSNLLKSIRAIRVSDFFQSDRKPGPTALLEEKRTLSEEAKSDLRPGPSVLLEEQKTCSDFKSIGIIDGLDFSHYTINSYGVIKNSLTNETRELGKPKSGYLYLRLNSKQGKRFLARHELVAKVHLEKGGEYFNSINYEVIHKDGNKTNNNSENLEWIMNTNVVDTSDFKSIGEIDGCDLSHYQINSQGIVINTKNKNQIFNSRLHSNGYLYLSFYINSGKIINVSQHRLVGKVFFKNGEESFKECLENGKKKYQINHRDKNRTNNCIENLEWTTPSENMTHSHGRRVVRIDLETGEELQTYNTIKEAGTHLMELLKCDKISTGRIGQVCRGKGKSSHGYGWRFAQNDEEEKEMYPPEVVRSSGQRPKGVEEKIT